MRMCVSGMGYWNVKAAKRQMINNSHWFSLLVCTEQSERLENSVDYLYKSMLQNRLILWLHMGLAAVFSTETLELPLENKYL